MKIAIVKWPEYKESWIYSLSLNTLIKTEIKIRPFCWGDSDLVDTNRSIHFGQLESLQRNPIQIQSQLSIKQELDKKLKLKFSWKLCLYWVVQPLKEWWIFDKLHFLSNSSNYFSKNSWTTIFVWVTQLVKSKFFFGKGYREVYQNNTYFVIKIYFLNDSKNDLPSHPSFTVIIGIQIGLLCIPRYLFA